ncbi:RND family efflux transporter, MFP subunit [Echinicola vietnamensis DSM 17526]|uniref:RND family efflux transporter, MFP subunit n=2 Tax=Echinicola TaxID=390846 RepID=L0FXP6_ECHVK|nr:RND family efflux transporter, MFP subunit [Echinicola vietnamensis DSM 17526]
MFLGAFLAGGIIGGVLTSGEGAKEALDQHDHKGETVYTCSMHPQIKQNEPGDCPICGMDLVPLSTLGDSEDTNPYVMTMSPEAVALANIATSTVKAGSEMASNHLTLSGTIEVDERNVKSVSANFDGRIDDLYVAFTGQEVKQGQRLARIYSPDLIAAHRELLEAKKATGISPKLYEAAKQKLKQWQLTDAQITKMANDEDYQPHFDIYAATSGVVTDRKVAAGDYVSRGQVLFEITNLNKVWVMLDAYEQGLGQISAGDQIQFSVNALPGEEFSAKVAFIDPVVSADSRSAKVRAEVNNFSGKLKPGMFVTAKLSTQDEAPVDAGVMVPKSSILWTGRRSVVYRQVGSEMKPAFEMVQVELGPVAGEMQQVLTGLSPGDQIVTNGVFAVDGAAQLSGKYSMMAHPEEQDFQVSESFGKVIEEVIAAYLTMKNRLVRDESGQAAAGNLHKLLTEENPPLSQEKALEKWKEISESLAANALAMSQTSDIAKQREWLVPVSNEMIKLLDAFGGQGKKLFKDYCPMAKNDQGAYWLSEFEEIKNPYFGASMLSCGEIKKVYPSQGSHQQKSGHSGHQH